MLQRLQTVILVTIITLLIWLIAEAQSLDSKSQSVQIRFLVTDQDSLVITSDNTVVTAAKLQLQGSTASLDRLVHSLTGPVQILIDTPGEWTIDLRARLAEIPPFKGSGVNIRDMDPQFIEQVRVERRETVSDLAVRIPDLPGVELNSPATVTPSVVIAEVPSSQARALRSAGYVELLVGPVVRSDLANLPPGRNELSVTLRLPETLENGHGRLLPDRVTLALDIRDKTAVWVPEQPLPVQVQLPEGLTGQYEIRFADEDRFIEVAFRGPAQAIEQLKQDRGQAVPFVALGSDDLLRRVTSAPIQFRQLPPGVTAQPAKDTVSFAITAMQAAP